MSYERGIEVWKALRIRAGNAVVSPLDVLDAAKKAYPNRTTTYPEAKELARTNPANVRRTKRIWAKVDAMRTPPQGVAGAARSLPPMSGRPRYRVAKTEKRRLYRRTERVGRATEATARSGIAGGAAGAALGAGVGLATRQPRLGRYTASTAGWGVGLSGLAGGIEQAMKDNEYNRSAKRYNARVMHPVRRK